MSLALLGLLLCPPVLAASWQGTPWTTSGDAPDLAVDPDTGDVHLAWLDGGAANHAVFSADGTLLATDREASWQGEGDGWTFGPGVAVGPGSEVYLSFKTSTGGWDYQTWLAVRSGGSWRSPIALQGAVERGYGSQVAADADGATVVVERADETPYGTMSAWAVEGGSLVSSGDVTAARVDDRVDVVAGVRTGARHAFAGYPNPGGHVYYAWSGDGGRGWSGGGAVESSHCSSGRNGQPDAAVDTSGRVHLVYGCSEDSEVGGPSVRHAVIADNAVVSDAPVTGPGQLSEWHLSLGIGRVATVGADHVLVAWLAHDEGALSVSHSVDGGQTWLSPVQLAEQGGDSEGRNAPAMVATGHTVFVAWSERGTLTLARAEVETPSDGEEPGDTGPGDPADTTGDTGAETGLETWPDSGSGDSDESPADPVGLEGEGSTGCGCTASPGGGAGLWLLGVLGLLVRRR